MNNLLKLLA